MGKLNDQLPVHQQEIDRDGAADSWICCGGCPIGVSQMCKVFNFRCFLVLILSVSVILSAIRWGWPHHSTNSGFDAKSAIKNSATVQASFRLQKPVSVLVPLITKLEYDINDEIGVPSTKVVILSIHSAPVDNLTDVVFGLLSDHVNAPINAVYLSVLKSSLVELFLEHLNLTLTNSTFGQPSLFEIVKFPGGVTVIPEKSPIWDIPQIFFNFTLHNSIDEIRQNFAELKQQLASGLNLTPDEDMYVQVTNEIGSTTDRPVTVQISVTSDQGGILPERIKQLAQTITGSPSKNLGLDHSVFGKVKQISLSSYLRNTLDASAPTPSPAPSPGENDYAEPSYSPDISPSYFPAPTPQYRHKPPCFDCDASPPSGGNNPLSPSPAYYSSTPMSNSPAPSIVYTTTPHPSPHCGSITPPNPSAAPSQSYAPPPNPLAAPSQYYPSPPNPSAAPSQYNPFPPAFSPHSFTPTGIRTPQVSPGPSPLPEVAYSSSPSKEKGNGKASDSLTSSSHVTKPSMKTWIFVIVILSTFHHLRGG